MKTPLKWKQTCVVGGCNECKHGAALSLYKYTQSSDKSLLLRHFLAKCFTLASTYRESIHVSQLHKSCPQRQFCNENEVILLLVLLIMLPASRDMHLILDINCVRIIGGLINTCY